jgi:hypothetical protein
MLRSTMTAATRRATSRSVPAWFGRALTGWRRLRRAPGDPGMATAEYAIATLAACGFAALLLTLMTSSEVRGLLFGIIKRALSAT